MNTKALIFSYRAYAFWFWVVCCGGLGARAGEIGLSQSDWSLAQIEDLSYDSASSAYWRHYNHPSISGDRVAMCRETRTGTEGLRVPTFDHDVVIYERTEAGFQLVETVRIEGRASSISFDGEFLAVGRAPATVDGFEVKGLVDLYERVQGEWRHIDRLIPPRSGGYTHERQEYGSCVALYGETLAVSAPGDDHYVVSHDGGVVFVYQKNSEGEWEFETELVPENPKTGDRFGGVLFGARFQGRTLAVYEDRIAVGVPFAENAGGQVVAGLVILFKRTGNGWQLEQTISPFNAGDGDLFGYALDLKDKRLVVGAPLEDGGGRGVDPEGRDQLELGKNSGAVYVYGLDAGGVWQREAYLKPSNTIPDLGFGRAVALSGDAIAVGSPGDFSAGSGINGSNLHPEPGWRLPLCEGAIHVFSRETGGWMPTGYLKQEEPESFAYFGGNLSFSGDMLVTPGLIHILPTFIQTLEFGRVWRSGEVYVHPALGRMVPASVDTWNPVWSISLHTWIYSDGGNFTSRLYGTLRELDPPAGQWLVSEHFGRLHWNDPAPGADEEGRVWTQRFGWVLIEHNGGEVVVQALNHNTRFEVLEDGSFLGIDFGRMTPVSGEITAYDTRIGRVWLDDQSPPGWLRSDRFGFVWFARNANAVWFWSEKRSEWLGITQEGGIWSTVEGRFL